MKIANRYTINVSKTLGEEMRMNKKGLIMPIIRRQAFVTVSIMIVIGVVLYGLLTKDKAKSQVLIFVGNAVNGEQLLDVSIMFIQGRDNPLGESFRQIVIETNEETIVELPYGEYTVQWSADGYYTSYQNVEVREKEIIVRKWLVPTLEENMAYIQVEWESETDIDLCVYNSQTGRCIGREATLEDVGCFSHGDNNGTKGYELIYLNCYDKNVYMIYTRNNERPVKNQRKDRKNTGIIVSIYNSNGLIYQKEPDMKKRTTLWHCADINYGLVEEWNESIYDLTEYVWATRDKYNFALWVEEADVKAEEEYEYSKTGKIYSIRENKYDLNGNWIAYYNHENDGSISIGYEYEYNEWGNLLASYTYEGGVLVFKSAYVYDLEMSRMLKKSYIVDGETELLTEQVEYNYDESGNKISTIYSDGDGTLNEKVECEYDENGNELSRCLYDGNGMLESRREYKYDKNGNELSRCIYDGNGVLESKWEYEYDAVGNEICCRRYGRNGVLESRWEYEYDAAGNEICCHEYGEEDLLERKVEFKYDSAGNCISRYTYDGEGELTEKREYDILGNQTAWYAYENGTLKNKYIYVYDANGNQTEYYEYHYQNGKFESGKMLRYSYNEKGECITYYGYDSNGFVDETKTYEHIYEYDTIGNMKIYYYYVDGILNTKTITLYY